MNKEGREEIRRKGKEKKTGRNKQTRKIEGGRAGDIKGMVEGDPGKVKSIKFQKVGVVEEERVKGKQVLQRKKRKRRSIGSNDIRCAM